MIFYFLVLLIPLFAYFLLVPTRQNKNFVVGITMLFFCFGYMTGSDWRSYELFYNQPENDVVSIDYFEPGFVFLNNVFRFFNIEFWHWFLFIKCVTFIIWTNFFNRYLSSHFFLTLFFFLGIYGVSVFIDNPFRNVISVSIFILAFKYIEERRFSKFLLYIILGISIHKSMLFILPFYYLSYRKYSTKSMLFTFVISQLLFILNIDIVKNLFTSLGNAIPLLSGRVDSYFNNDSEYSQGSLFSVGNLYRTVLFFLILLRRSKFEERFGNTFFNFIFFSFIIYELALSIPILGRLNLYFVPFFCISAVYLMHISIKELKIGTYAAILLLSTYSMYASITSSYKYLPYTNYLFYGPDPGYNFRFNYNFYNSPYSEKNN